MPSVILRTSLLLAASNIFMTFAWYAHLRNMSDKSWYVAALAVFVPFAVFCMKQPVALDYLWASLCVVGALYFMFRAQS